MNPLWYISFFYLYIMHLFHCVLTSLEVCVCVCVCGGGGGGGWGGVGLYLCVCLGSCICCGFQVFLLRLKFFDWLFYVNNVCINFFKFVFHCSFCFFDFFAIFGIFYFQWVYQMVNISMIFKFLTWHGFDTFSWNHPFRRPFREQLQEAASVLPIFCYLLYTSCPS